MKLTIYKPDYEVQAAMLLRRLLNEDLELTIDLELLDHMIMLAKDDPRYKDLKIVCQGYAQSVETIYRFRAKHGWEVR